MRNKEEVVAAFTANPKLNEVQKSALLRVEMAFKDLATEVVDLVPECPDRTAALRKLLDSKLTCAYAISCCKEAGSKPVQKEKENEVKKSK